MTKSVKKLKNKDTKDGKNVKKGKFKVQSGHSGPPLSWTGLSVYKLHLQPLTLGSYLAYLLTALISEH